MIEFKNILFPTDFSDFSSYAANFALSFASGYGAKLHVLHVVETPIVVGELIPFHVSMEEVESKAKQLALGELESAAMPGVLEGLDYEVNCRKGKPFVEIIKFAREKKIDLIVMGTHGRSALESMLLGSTAEKVVRKSLCPVFTVRKPGHRFVMPAIG